MGGASTSEANTTNTETNTTNTTTFGLQESQGNVVGSGNNVTFSDSGAIQAAVDINSSNQAFLGQSFSSVLGFLQDDAQGSRALAADAISANKDAYASASGGLDSNKTVLLLAFVVVGGILFFGRR